jgi:hypothetical protein
MLCRVFWMVEASIHMCMCEIIVGVVLATQMDPVTGVISQAATIGLIVVVSAFSFWGTGVGKAGHSGVGGWAVGGRGGMVGCFTSAAEQHDTVSGCVE